MLGLRLAHIRAPALTLRPDQALPDGPKAEGAPKLVTVLCPNTWACPAAVMALTVVLLFSGLTGGQDSAEALDDSVAGLELITSPGANGETYFIKDDPQALTKGKHTTVPLPPDVSAATVGLG